jgi:hypothetical protein
MEAPLVYEFLLLLSPAKRVTRFVARQKNLLYKEIGYFDSVHSLAHITLTNYIDYHNDSRLYDIELLIVEFSSFELCTNGFQVFHQGLNRTIYLDIVQKNPVRDIAEKLNKKNITPHITIAKNLTPDVFGKAWELLKTEVFCDYFQCWYVTVLKRPLYSNSWINYMQLDLRKSFDY